MSKNAIKKKWKFTNGWTSPSKQWDKINIQVRLGKISVLTIKIDISRKQYSFTILNFGFEK